jgi:UDP-N-acetylmuramoyl-tripeptide--D-alanyl-D-alanine ligase
VGITTLHICGDQEGALDVARNIEPGDVILVKASRSQRFEILAAGIEEVIRSLNEDFESREGEVK